MKTRLQPSAAHRGWLPRLVLLSLLSAACGSSTTPAKSTASGEFQHTLKLAARGLDPHAAGIGKLVPDLGFEDIEGRRGKLSNYADQKALVIVIRDVGCPVSKRYGMRTGRLEEEYAERGVAFLFVNESSHNTTEEMLGEVEQYGFEGRYAHDPEEHLGRALRAETTTEVFVLDGARTLLYRGAVDDQYGRGFTLPAPRRQFLRAALDEVLAGREVTVKATFAPGCFLGIELADEAPADHEVTYHQEIARIFQLNCVECHRTGGAAPFPLDTYEQVRGRKGMVGYMVAEGLMPPWFAADDCGPWKNDLRLVEQDRESILAWIDGGMPAGDPADAPVPIRWREGWTIGEPDLIFEFPEPFQVPADGIIEYMPFVSETVVPEDIWIERMQVLPGDPEVVHHATVSFKRPGGPSRGEFREDLIGALIPWSKGLRGWRFLYGYLPGKGPRVYTEDTARFLPKGSMIRFEMHYTTKGVPVEDLTRLGIVLARNEPNFVAQTRMIRNYNVKIAPGARDVMFTQDYRVAAPVLLRSLTPHMHLRGRTFHADVILPDGSTQNLIKIPEWDQDWQFSYIFAEQVALPAGATIRITGWYDNSADNPNNPDPTRWVNDGQQIWDEMFMMAVEWVVPRGVRE